MEIECEECYDSIGELYFGSNSTTTYNFKLTADVQNLPEQQIESTSLFYVAPC